MCHWALSLGPVFLLIAVTALSLGLSYGGVFGSYVRMVHPLENWIDHRFWTVVWLIVGFSGWALSFGIPCKWVIKNLVITGWASLAFIWGTSWFVSWATNDADRGVARAAWYMGTALYVGWSIWRFRQYEKHLAKMTELANFQAEEIERLDAENAKLRARIAELEQEVAYADMDGDAA